MELSQKLILTGGYQFLLDMFNKIDKKNIDYDEDILPSKTIGILIQLLQRCYNSKLLNNLKAM
jgi:hypothetical protein